MASKKLALTLLMIMLGLASWNAALENTGGDSETRATYLEGGIPRPPD